MSSYAKHDEKFVTLDDHYSIQVWWERNRNGFRHLAILRGNGAVMARNKCCYMNRTWESYQYASVIHGVIRAGFHGEETVKHYIALADAGGRDKNVGAEADCAPLRHVAALGALAKLIAADPEQEARLKKLSVASLPGIEIPPDFDGLPVAERLRRLDGVLEIAGK